MLNYDKDCSISGDVSDAGTGVGFFAGRGEVDLAGDFPAGDFIGDEQAQFDGASQIQVKLFLVEFTYYVKYCWKFFLMIFMLIRLKHKICL